MRPERLAGQALLHPLTLAALLVLVVNDHIAKMAYPGVITGKLSDVAGMVLFPLILVAAYEWWRGPSAFGRHHRTVVVAAVVATGLVFTMVKTLPAAGHAYRVVWAALQWPALTAWSLMTEATVPGLRPVALTRDVSDLIALPALALSAWIARRPAVT